MDIARRNILFACFLVLGVVVPGEAQTTPAKIVGINPNEADVGDKVRLRLTGKPSSEAILTVDGVPVQINVQDDPLWVMFEVPPTRAPGEKKIAVTLLDRGVSTDTLFTILPFRVVNVSPLSGPPGAEISVTVRPDASSGDSANIVFRQSASTAEATSLNSTSPATKVTAGSSTWKSTVPNDAVPGPAVIEFLGGGQTSEKLPGFIVTPLPWWQRNQKAIAVIALAYLGAAIGALYWFRRRRLVKQDTQLGPTFIQGVSASVVEQTHASPLEPDGRGFEVPPLEVPEDLVEAVARGQCVLYAGAGLSARAGLPTWTPFTKGLVRWAERENLIDSAFARSLDQAVDRGGADRAADSVMSAVIEHQHIDGLSKHLEETFRTSSLPDVHQILGTIGFNAALTTNFDGLIEHSFASSSDHPSVRVPSDIDRLRSSFSEREFFVLKLYGTPERPDSLVVAPAQYVERMRGDRPFADFVQQLFHTRTLLFLGSSIAGIEAYLAPLRVRPGSQRKHYAVVAVEDAGWQADADLLDRRYGIRVLPYAASAQHVEVLSFVKELSSRVKSAGKEAAGVSVSTDDEEAAVHLRRLELHNIGPFERLELEFTRRWTILLGDNGVGKSSILRALAAAVAGDHGGVSGGRLLRAGQTEGHITITTSDHEEFGARISLDSLKRPEVVAEGSPPLGGSWLVLAFPAIRTMGAGQGRGPELKEWTQPPNADDVLPILEAVADPRILGFKQWLINLDYAKTRGPELKQKAEAVLDSLGRTLGILLGNMKLQRLEVVDKDVFVETEDGRLPLDALSQGTVSVLGWVGVLVQRLHEISTADGSAALVIIDEIDAHMHPEWQQAIISRLVDAFPKVQFIVSTHSPFLAVGRRADEIIRFRRDPRTRKAIAERADRDTVDMTVADVLTSYLFGLQTSVDHELQKDVLRLRELSLKETLNDAEKSEMAGLQKRLNNVGVAATQADPMYGKFIEALGKQRTDELTKLPPLSKEMEARQRELTKQIVRDVLTESPSPAREAR